MVVDELLAPVLLVLAPVLLVLVLAPPVRLPVVLLSEPVFAPLVEVDAPPCAVLLVLPPEMVPVVVLVEFCSVCGLNSGLMVRSDALDAAEVPLRLLLLVVPEADDGFDVSPTVWLFTEQDVALGGQSLFAEVV